MELISRTFFLYTRSGPTPFPPPGGRGKVLSSGARAASRILILDVAWDAGSG